MGMFDNLTRLNGSLYEPTGDKGVDDFLLFVSKKVKEARANFDTASGRYVITPKIARHILQNMNAGNRPIKESAVRKKADILKRGQHRVTSQGLVFDDADLPALMDGQHRMAAIRDTGLSAEYKIIFGEPRENFDVFDTAEGRKAADVVAIAHCDEVEGASGQHKQLSAAAVLAWRLEEQDLNISYTNRDILAGIESMPGLKIAVPEGAKLARKLKQWGTKTAFAVALERIRRQSADDSRVAEFIERLYDGAGEPKRSPLLLLRDRLMGGQLGEEFTGRVRMAHVAACIVTTWNHWVAGKRLPVKTLEESWLPEMPLTMFPRAD